ncbi:MAG: replication-associated recombination protein A [Candidatus Howiella sp.]|jgi:putative ATPase
MSRPLADRMRPKTLDNVVGQTHLLGQGKVLRRIIESGQIPNLIFYGPSGVGKTTVAEIIANGCGKRLHRLNATTASTADIKDMVAEVGTFAGKDGILLYLDEIQYFNKRQQQTLLEHIEKGSITLIASTTENPRFYIYNALLSRSTVFEFKELTPEEILPAVHRGAAFLEEEKGVPIRLSDTAARALAYGAGGDVRKALGGLELCVIAADSGEGEITVSDSLAEEICGGGGRYDRLGDEHYDLLSAYQKSMRGSDPDAALHYLARILAAGDLPSACRRLLVCAAEDVGLAYPQALPIVKACVDAALMVGLPEARIPLADAVVLVATAPKSNSAYNGINAAMADIEAGNIGPIPRQLQNQHTDGAEVKNPGQNYLYPHDFPGHYVKQQYLPDRLKGKNYYVFGENKNEQAFKAYLDKLKNGGN